MIRRALSIFGLLMLASPLLAQSSPPTIYAESFRQDEGRVTEDRFEAKLTPENATYRELIKDSYGNNRYELTITPQGPEGDNKITAWRVKLRDFHHTIYANILLAQQEPSDDPKNLLWWLNPNPSGSVPILTKRIVKVNGFYVVIQVKALHFTPLDSPYLDTMAVQFVFSNSDPRASR